MSTDSISIAAAVAPAVLCLCASATLDRYVQFRPKDFVVTWATVSVDLSLSSSSSCFPSHVSSLAANPQSFGFESCEVISLSEFSPAIEVRRGCLEVFQME